MNDINILGRTSEHVLEQPLAQWRFAMIEQWENTKAFPLLVPAPSSEKTRFRTPNIKLNLSYRVPEVWLLLLKIWRALKLVSSSCKMSSTTRFLMERNLEASCSWNSWVSMNLRRAPVARIEHSLLKSMRLFSRTKWSFSLNLSSFSWANRMPRTCRGGYEAERDWMLWFLSTY